MGNQYIEKGNPRSQTPNNIQSIEAERIDGFNSQLSILPTNVPNRKHSCPIRDVNTRSLLLHLFAIHSVDVSCVTWIASGCTYMALSEGNETIECVFPMLAMYITNRSKPCVLAVDR